MAKQWTLKYDPSGCFELFDENNSILATIFGEPEKAYLMGSAPDLLEALETVMRLSGDYVNEHPVIAEKVNAAIAKTKGGTTDAV